METPRDYIASWWRGGDVAARGSDAAGQPAADDRFHGCEDTSNPERVHRRVRSRTARSGSAREPQCHPPAESPDRAMADATSACRSDGMNRRALLALLG